MRHAGTHEPRPMVASDEGVGVVNAKLLQFRAPPRHGILVTAATTTLLLGSLAAATRKGMS